jgi:hypothetical protein
VPGTKKSDESADLVEPVQFEARRAANRLRARDILFSVLIGQSVRFG